MLIDTENLPGMFLRQSPDDTTKTVQSGLHVLDDLGGQIIRFRQVIQIGQTFVLEPEDVQAALVPCDDLFTGELAPPPFGIGSRVPALFPLMAVERVVADNKLLQVIMAQRLLLQGMVDIGPVVIKPDFPGPGMR